MDLRERKKRLKLEQLIIAERAAPSFSAKRRKCSVKSLPPIWLGRVVSVGQNTKRNTGLYNKYGYSIFIKYFEVDN